MYNISNDVASSKQSHVHEHLLTCLVNIMFSTDLYHRKSWQVYAWLRIQITVGKTINFTKCLTVDVPTPKKETSSYKLFCGRCSHSMEAMHSVLLRIESVKDREYE